MSGFYCTKLLTNPWDFCIAKRLRASGTARRTRPRLHRLPRGADQDDGLQPLVGPLLRHAHLPRAGMHLRRIRDGRQRRLRSGARFV